MSGIAAHSGTEVGERLALTLAGSLILHFALIFGLQVRALPIDRAPATVIQARLVESHAIPPEAAPAEPPPPASPEAMELQPAEPSPATPEPAPVNPVAPQTQQMASAAPAETAEHLPSVEVPLIEDTTYYPAKQVDVHPTALQAIQPSYPDAAANSDVSGSVILLLLLDEGGKVREISVEEANPPGHFEESAIAAFRNARFSPAQRNGKVVKSRVLIKVSYELEGKKGR